MSGSPTTVVYIEDDAKLGRLTQTYLESHGLIVVLVVEPRDAVVSVLRERPDVVLLDVMLPEMDGLGLCRQIRAHVETPIIIVTALGEEADRVLGLESGADDYIAKPFSSRELLARVRAQARRARRDASAHVVTRTAGPLSIDATSRRATLDGDQLSLTTYEFDLLRVFVERAGQVLTRERLVELVRGSSDEAFDRSIDVHISHLRRKLGDDPRNPRFLMTVRGVGYLLAQD